MFRFLRNNHTSQTVEGPISVGSSRASSKRSSISSIASSMTTSQATMPDDATTLGSQPGSVVNSLPGRNPEKKGILRSLSFQFTPFTGTKRRRAAAEASKSGHTYDSTPEVEGSIAIGPVMGVQCQGLLMKKCKNKSRIKWNRRFFILKECFLLYYAAKQKKKYDKSKKIDMHPKGIVPLIGCSIVPGGDIGKGKKYCLLITHPQFDNAVIVAAADARTQEKWLKALRDATKISFSNTVVGESLIRELESKGQLLNEEKRGYEEQLRLEGEARKKEIERSLALERTKEELEKEREKLVKLTKKLKDDLHNVKNDLKLTNESKKTLEQEKVSLMTKTQSLVSNLESLNMEKSKIEEHMSQIIREREKFLLENQNLSSTTCQLKNRLMEIESKTTCLATEKEKVENLLRLNEKKTVDLESERQYYNRQTRDLLTSLKEISQQKEMTEAELRDAVMARLGAEKQLQAAEKALEHLENALRLTGAQMTELQEHIMPDVHKLREFFEQCAEEARMEAEKCSIMKTAVYARRSFRRNKARKSFRRHTSMKTNAKPSYLMTSSDVENNNETIEL
uniref:PH domain-containing protein n=1 Tax=Panagrellus redivivus TaxID=6233 RepID=A0A7E4VJ67_PANRE